MKHQTRIARLEAKSAGIGTTIFARAPAAWTEEEKADALSQFLTEEQVDTPYSVDIRPDPHAEELEVYFCGNLNAALLAASKSRRIGVNQ